MSLKPKIDNLDDVLAYILSQMSDHIARQSTQDKANESVFKVTEEDPAKDQTKKEYNCKVCEKKHASLKCSYVCKPCKRMGHRAEACWSKFPEMASGYMVPSKDKPRKPRKSTPGLNKRKNGRRSKSQGFDRGSSYDVSGSEAESPHRNRRRRRHRSNRVKVVEEDQGNPSVKGVGSSNSDLLPLWEPSQNKNRHFVNCIRVGEKDDGAVGLL